MTSKFNNLNLVGRVTADKILKKINESEGRGDNTPLSRLNDSRFWDIRPVRIVSGAEWTYESGYYYIVAAFTEHPEFQIKLWDRFRTSVDNGFGSGSGDDETHATGYAVWRGRWELLSASSSGGGGVIVRTLPETLYYNETVTLTINDESVNVGCPLLKSGESIPSGSTVILTRNLETGDWIIIEASCP